MKPARFLLRGLQSTVRRLRSQGMARTALWLYGQGVPLLTGVPILQFSRITQAVHVGPQHGRTGKRFLERNGFTHSVSLRAELDDAAHGLSLRCHCHLPTIDGHPPTIEQLEQGVAFLAEAVAGGAKVYIHCQSGIGRAPTLAAAYLISQGSNWTTAVDTIRRIRPFIDLTPGQVEQLGLFKTLKKPAC